MAAFGCFFQILTISNAEIQAFWGFWCFLSLISWMFAFCFIYFAVTAIRHGPSHNGKHETALHQRQKQRFATLMVMTDIIISLHVTVSLPTCLFWIHLFRGHNIAPNIDYLQDLNQCNVDGYNFYTVLSTIFGPVSGILYDLSCIMILTTYFYRLHKIFYGSMFEISTTKIRIAIMLMMIFVLISIIREYFIIDGNNLDGVLISWNIFLGMYFIMSLSLVWNLRKQATLLKIQTLRMMLGSVQMIMTGTMTSNTPQTASPTAENVESTKKVKKTESTQNCKEGSAERTKRDDKTISSQHKMIRIQLNNPAIVKVNNIARVFGRLVLLAYVCVVSSLSVIILSVLVYEVFIDVIDTKYGYILDLFYWTLIYVDNVINIVCISLQFDNFGYFDWIYNFCCTPCEKHLKLITESENINININTTAQTTS